MKQGQILIEDAIRSVCEHLSLDENLFIVGEQSMRITQGRLYLFYVAIYHYHLDALLVRKYFGLSETDIVKKGAYTIAQRLIKGMGYQLEKDIKAIIKKLKYERGSLLIENKAA